jgi:ABC-2 type transport system ATP-binding protein
MLAIKTENLSKRYGANLVLDGVSMHVEQGAIYGLIGNNGAGKTTLFRIIIGLVNKNGGSFEIYGESTQSGLESMRKNIGSIIEIPSLQPNLTAFQNLKAQALALRCFDKEKIEELLKKVDLFDKRDVKFANFSLGMKQRLAIAAALLNDPKLLILDEPTNGLDPSGIMEIRELILRLNSEGKTILISSHLISELSKVANAYGVMHKGKLVKELSTSELAEISRPMLKLVVNDVLKASEVLREKLKLADFATFPNNTIKLYEMTDKAQTVSKELAVGGVLVMSIEYHDNDLENYFISLMGGRANG